MGLFSHQHSLSPKGHLGKGRAEEIFVFIRASHSTDDISPSRNLRWSIAVASRDPTSWLAGESGQGNGDGLRGYKNEQHKQHKQRRSLLSFKTRHSSGSEDKYSKSESFLSTGATASAGDGERVSSPVVYEFGLSSGDGLHVTRIDALSRPQTVAGVGDRSDGGSNPDSSLLLQILLPQPSPTSLPRGAASTTALHHQVEQILHRHDDLTNSADVSNLSDPEPKNPSAWVESGLVALQQGNLLVSGSSGLNVSRFMTYARNLWSGFENEVSREQCQNNDAERDFVSSNSNSNDQNFTWASSLNLPGAQYTKRVDYAAHVTENQRLKALLGADTGSTVRADAGMHSDETSSSPSSSSHIHGGMGGGWWVSRPHDYSRRERDHHRDPYAGLM